MNLPTLKNLLEYKNPRVIRRFQNDYPALADQADKLFEEALKFLWLSGKHSIDREKSSGDDELNFLLMMYEDMRDVDYMWHSFILFTQEYSDFCERYFGEFMHHNPDAIGLLPKSREDFVVDYKKYLSYVYDNLGPETMESWFKVPLSSLTA